MPRLGRMQPAKPYIIMKTYIQYVVVPPTGFPYVQVVIA